MPAARTHRQVSKEKKHPPLWKLRHPLLQAIMVTIRHELVWVQIQMDERERHTEDSVRSSEKAALFLVVRLEEVEASIQDPLGFQISSH